LNYKRKKSTKFKDNKESEKAIKMDNSQEIKNNIFIEEININNSLEKNTPYNNIINKYNNNYCESSINDNSTYINKKIINDNNNNTNDKEIIFNNKFNFSVNLFNNILDTEIRFKPITDSKTGNFNFDFDKEDQDSKDSFTDKDNEKINIIKNQIRKNLTLFDNKLNKYNSSKESSINEIKSEVQSDNKNVDETKSSNHAKLLNANHINENTEDKKNVSNLLLTNGNSILENKNKKKDIIQYKRKILERKNTDNLLNSQKLRRAILPSSKHSFNIAKKKFLKENTLSSNPNNNNNFNDNCITKSYNNSISDIDEVFNLKSFKLIKQKTLSHNLQKLGRNILFKLNSHISHKSNSSNKNSIFTFNNHLSSKDKDSLDIGYSILKVNLIHKIYHLI